MRKLLLALLPLAAQAQTYNFFGSDGVFAGSVQSTPYMTSIFGDAMQPEGFITSSSPRPLEPLLPMAPHLEAPSPLFAPLGGVSPLEAPTFGLEPLKPLSLDGFTKSE